MWSVSYQVGRLTLIHFLCVCVFATHVVGHLPLEADSFCTCLFVAACICMCLCTGVPDGSIFWPVCHQLLVIIFCACQLDLVSVAKVKIILSVLCNEIIWFNTWRVCLFVCVCVSMSACLLLCLSTSVSICLSVYLPLCMSACLSAAVSARITQRRDCPGVVCQVVRRPVGYVDVVILRWSTPTDATYSQRPWHWRQTHSSTRQQVTCLPWTYVSRPCVVKRLTSGQQGVDAV